MRIVKRILLILTLCAAAVICGSCQAESASEYDELNAKLKLDYSKIQLTVTNGIDEETELKSEYVLNFSDDGIKVAYSVERLTELSLDCVESEKITLTGEATIADGKVSYVQGDEINLDVVARGVGLDFKEEYFENIDLTGVYLRADVKNPSGFMGSELTCTEMKVEATFLEILYDIHISYLAQSGNRVEYLYTFSI